MRKKLLEHVERLFDKPPCDVCRKIMESKGREPKNCVDCLPPLRKENEDAVKIYLMTRNQLIFAGMGEPVEINHLAVHEAMRLYRVRNKKECFEQVLQISAHMLELSAEQDKKDGLDTDQEPL